MCLGGSKLLFKVSLSSFAFVGADGSKVVQNLVNAFRQNKEIVVVRW